MVEGIEAPRFEDSTRWSNAMTPATRRQYLHVAVCGAAVAGLSSIGWAQNSQQSIREQLIGTWTLVSAKNTSPAGVTRDLFGSDPKGILMLQSSGRYAQVQ